MLISMTKDILVLLGGGTDSLTLLHKAHNDGFNVKTCITFDYGQKWKREIIFAKKQVIDFNKRFNTDVKHIIYKINFDAIGKRKKNLFIFGRNMIFLSIAASIAASMDIKYLGYAVVYELAFDFKNNTFSKARTFLDGSQKFINDMEKSFITGTGKKIKIYAPFANLVKHEEIKQGLEIGVPYELSISCNNNRMKNNEPCIIHCEKCYARTLAFILNYAKDPAVKDWNNVILKFYGSENIIKSVRR